MFTSIPIFVYNGLYAQGWDFCGRNVYQNDSFIKKAQEVGSYVVKMVHSQAGHGFDAFNANSFETKLIIDKTLKFIEDGSN